MNSEKFEISDKSSVVIGEITSGSLHTLKNYLQSIMGLSELIDANPKMPEDARMDAKAILEIAGDAADLVNQMRAATKPEPQPVVAEPSIPAISPTIKSRSDVNILIAEDDPMVLRVVAGMLKALGYSTTQTTDGQEAYEKYMENPNAIAMILADLDMPRMSGLQLADVLLKSDPDTKIVVMTGYIHQELGIDPDEFGLSGWLEKPMTAARIEAVIKPLVGV